MHGLLLISGSFQSGKQGKILKLHLDTTLIEIPVLVPVLGLPSEIFAHYFQFLLDCQLSKTVAKLTG